MEEWLTSRHCELGEEAPWHRVTMLEYSTRSDVRHFLPGGRNEKNIIGQRHIKAYTRKESEHAYTHMNMHVHAYRPTVHWLKHNKMHWLIYLCYFSGKSFWRDAEFVSPQSSIVP